MGKWKISAQPFYPERVRGQAALAHEALKKGRFSQEQIVGGHLRKKKKVTQANVQTREFRYIQMLATCLKGKGQGQHTQLTSRPGIKLESKSPFIWKTCYF